MADLQSQLAEAEAALHDIRVNGATRRLRHGDKEEWFSPATVGDLQNYISTLKSQLGIGGRPASRRVIF